MFVFFWLGSQSTLKKRDEFGWIRNDKEKNKFQKLLNTTSTRYYIITDDTPWMPTPVPSVIVHIVFGKKRFTIHKLLL